MSFPIFNSMFYTGQPDLPGLHSLHLSDRAFFRVIGPNQYDKTQGDEALTRSWARETKGRLACINIELWPLDIRTVPDAEVERSIDLLGEIIDWIRDEDPGVRLGIYGIMPIRDYWTPVSGISRIPWITANARLRKSRNKRGRWIAEGLSDKVDVVFPSIYPFYDDAPGWEKYAVANHKQARDYGKQVYSFYQLHYHNSNRQGLAGKLVKVTDAALAGDVSREHADGMVIWGGWQYPWSDDVAARVAAMRGDEAP